MPEKKFLHQLYSNSMSRHGYGYAFYEPVSSNIVKPGVCGYLDENSNWNPVANLTDSVSLMKNGFSPVGEVERAPVDGGRHWGPKISDSVSYVRVNLKAGASGRSAGIPAEASVQYTFSTSKNFGAILICSKRITQERIYHKAPFKKWAQANAHILQRNHPDVKKHGFFIVTTTFSTPRVSLNTWTNPKNKVTIGFKTSAVDIGEIAPSSEWYSAESASGWVHSNAEGDERKVVFIGGLYFKYHWFGRTNHMLKEVPYDKWPSFRSENEETSFIIHDPDDDGHSYEVGCVTVGDDSKSEDEGNGGQDVQF